MILTLILLFLCGLGQTNGKLYTLDSFQDGFEDSVLSVSKDGVVFIHFFGNDVKMSKWTKYIPNGTKLILEEDETKSEVTKIHFVWYILDGSSGPIVVGWREEGSHEYLTVVKGDSVTVFRELIYTSNVFIESCLIPGTDDYFISYLDMNKFPKMRILYKGIVYTVNISGLPYKAPFPGEQKIFADHDKVCFYSDGETSFHLPLSLFTEENKDKELIAVNVGSPLFDYEMVMIKKDRLIFPGIEIGLSEDEFKCIFSSYDLQVSETSDTYHLDYWFPICAAPLYDTRQLIFINCIRKEGKITKKILTISTPDEFTFVEFKFYRYPYLAWVESKDNSSPTELRLRVFIASTTDEFERLEEIINTDLSIHKEPPKKTTIKPEDPSIKPEDSTIKPVVPTIKPVVPPIKPEDSPNINGIQVSSLLLYISIIAFLFLGLSMFLYQKSSTRTRNIKTKDPIRKRKKKTSTSTNRSTFDRKRKSSKPLNKRLTF